MVIPAVIPTSRHHLDVTLELFSSFTDAIQVDIVDGVFAPVASWPYTSAEHMSDALRSLRFEGCDAELDLMIHRPEETIEAWYLTGASRIIVHVESTDALDAILEHAAVHTYQLGLSFNTYTDLSLLADVIPRGVDFVQLMGIAEIGSQGQPFDDCVLERIRYVKEMYPTLPVSIDGGVNEDTIRLLRSAGADRFVSGSAILKAEDPRHAYHRLVELATA